MQQLTSPAGLLSIATLLALCCLRPVCAEGKLQIYTVNYPLAYFAERIAGDLAEVRFPAPRNVDPAFWVPDTETIAAYQTADLILLNGAGYAKWTSKVSLPGSRLVDTSRGFADAYIQVGNGVSHSHGPTGEHTHAGVAFTTWLDLSQAAQQAEAVAEAVTRKSPAARERIERNLQELKGELLALDQRLLSIAGTDPKRPLLASHPVYQYLARRYRLNLRSVMWEPEEIPSESQWAALAGLLKEHPAQWMLWEGEPAEKTVERLRALGVASIVLSPCSNRPATGDFLSVMSENASNLGRIFRQDLGEP